MRSIGIYKEGLKGGIIMFKDSYKRANDAVKLSDSQKEQMLDDIKKAKQRRHTRVLPYAAGAIAACLLLLVVLDVFSVFEGGLFHSVNKKKYDAKSYADIYEKLSPLCKGSNDLKGEGFDKVSVSEDMNGAAVPEATGSSEEFSQTNVQTEGVDEGDIVKTDGEYIYILSYTSSSISIYKADGENTELVSENELFQSSNSASIYYSDMYYYDDMLIIIANEYKSEYSNFFGYYHNVSEKTKLFFYDVKVKTSPELINSIAIDGSYVQSRLTKGILYVVTSYRVSSGVKKSSPETYIPSYCDENGEALVRASDICIPENIESASYTTVSAVDMENTGKLKSSASILGGSTDIYASSDSIIIYRNYSDHKETKIEVSDGSYTVLSDNADSNAYLYESSSKAYLYLVSMNGGNVEFTAHTTVDGYIDSQFCIDEYDGYFRVVATGETYRHAMREVNEGEMSYSQSLDIAELNENSKSSTTLYVLDKKLDVTGKIEDIASGEYVKSARFMGDIGYFVTFRQTDPLFSVDLSDPKKPKVLGELKIPGFSEYLQSYGEDLLLGFGMAADMYTGGTYGLKLSMFNIKDPTNVKEVACREIRDAYSAALYNHKAILADAKKNIIGFPVNEGYMIFSYEKGEFKLKGTIKDECSWNDNMRGLYIGEYYYVVDAVNVSVTVLDLNNFKLLCKK